ALGEIEAEQQRRREDHDRLDRGDERGDPDRLASEDRAARERGDEQPEERRVLALTLPGAAQREDRRERDRDPDDPRRDVLRAVLFSEERDRRDDRDEDGEEARGREDLSGRELDPEVLLRDEPGLAEPAGPAWQSSLASPSNLASP